MPHSDSDLEVLRLAITQLRAERQAQLQQQLDSQAELSINSFQSFVPNLVPTGGSQTTSTPLLAQGGPAKSVEVPRDRKAVAATLDLIHSRLQQEPVEERREGRAETPTGGWRSGESQGGGGGEAGDQRAGTPVRVEGLLGEKRGPSKSDTSTPLPNQSTAAVTGPSIQTDSTSNGRENADQQEEPLLPRVAAHAAASCSTTVCPAESDRSGETHSGQEKPIREGAPPDNSTTSGTKIQQPQQHLQQLNNQQLRPSLSHLQPPLHSLQQQQRGVGLLQSPHMPRFPSQPFSRSSMLAPLTTLGGGLLGSTPVWPGGLGPAGAAALVWGFRQAGRDVTGPSLLGGYHNPAGQGSSRYRGGQR